MNNPTGNTQRIYEMRKNAFQWIRGFLVDIHGAGKVPEVKIEFSNRMINTAGRCRYFPSTKHFLITMSARFIEANLDNPDLIKQICGHEAAHTKHLNHGGGFIDTCMRIGIHEYGQVIREDVVPSKTKYTGVCPNCGQEFRRNTKPLETSTFRHRDCGGVIEFRQNW